MKNSCFPCTYALHRLRITVLKWNTHFTPLIKTIRSIRKWWRILENWNWTKKIPEWKKSQIVCFRFLSTEKYLPCIFRSGNVLCRASDSHSQKNAVKCRKNLWPGIHISQNAAVHCLPIWSQREQMQRYLEKYLTISAVHLLMQKWNFTGQNLQKPCRKRLSNISRRLQQKQIRLPYAITWAAAFQRKFCGSRFWSIPEQDVFLISTILLERSAIALLSFRRCRMFVALKKLVTNLPEKR